MNGIEKGYDTYEVRGKNGLKVTYEDKTATFEIRNQFLMAPLNRKQAKRLILDLQQWVSGGDVERGQWRGDCECECVFGEG